MSKNRKCRISHLAAVVLSLSAMGVHAGETSTEKLDPLTAFVQKEWKLPDFQPGRDVVMSTTSLRVSTYSSPPFIHRSQLERLGDKANQLQALCGQQQGQWRHLGTPIPETKIKQSLPVSPNPMLLAAINSAPKTEDGMRSLMAIGEKTVADDVAKLIAKSLMQEALSRPDFLVTDALEYAAQQKFIGRYECIHDELPWAAAISYSGWKARAEGNQIIYRDVTFKVALTMSQKTK